MVMVLIVRRAFLLSFVAAGVISGTGCQGRVENPSMIFVEGGTFMMGDEFGDGNKDNGSNDERPVHAVTVNSFWIAQYEVTQKEWMAVMGTNPSIFVGDDLPVEMISWYDCVEYCNRRSVREGLTPCYVIGKNPDPDNTNQYDTLKWTVATDPAGDGYRLPTEEEWEFAARGGLKSNKTRYSGSNDINEVAEYFDNNNLSTKPVGSRKPNELNLFDMSGNLWEWCFDSYERYPGNNDPDPNKHYSPNYRVLRGGAWNYEAEYCRVSNRTGHGCSLRSDHYGLRLARPANER